jgi:pimeloyl-ACP methyl ester carboxylesterase
LNLKILIISLFIPLFIFSTVSIITIIVIFNETIVPVYGQNKNEKEYENDYLDSISLVTNLSKARVNDIDIAYKIYDNGNNNNTILLIAGSGQTMNAWESYFIKKLVASNNTVIVFDNRGIGNTTQGTKPFSIKQFANDTVGLLEKLEIDEKIDILGFSMGSLIAQEIPLIHPDKVSKLILYGSTCGGGKDAAVIPDKKVMDIFYTLRNQTILKNISADEINKNILFLYFPEDWIENNTQYLKNFLVTSELLDPEIFKLQGEAYLNWNGSCDNINNIRIPTLVIVGTEDVATLPIDSIKLVQKIPGALLIQIKDAGHGLMYQYPERFSEVIQLFLNEL